MRPLSLGWTREARASTRSSRIGISLLERKTTRWVARGCADGASGVMIIGPAEMPLLFCAVDLLDVSLLILDFPLHWQGIRRNAGGSREGCREGSWERRWERRRGRRVVVELALLFPISRSAGGDESRPSPSPSSSRECVCEAGEGQGRERVR